MHYCQIKTADIADGAGVRVSLFVSGCTNCCKGCFQPETWDFEYGEPYTKAVEDGLIEELRKPYYRGLTLLGGEPMEPDNQRTLVKLLQRVRQEVPDRDVWCYTGFRLDDELAEGGRKFCEVTASLLELIDVLVDGRFEEEQASIMLKFKGSANQRVIDLNATRAGGEIVLSEYDG